MGARLRSPLRGTLALGVLLAAALAGAAAADDGAPIALGRARVATQAPRGLFGPGADVPARPPHLGEAFAARAVPTNQWYSAVMATWPTRPVYALPLSVRSAPEGFEIGVPARSLVPTTRGVPDVRFPHRAQIVLSPLGRALSGTTLADSDDWMAQFDLQAGGEAVARLRVLHGSPFVYVDARERAFVLRLADGTAHPDGDGRHWRIDAGGRGFGLFLPEGASVTLEADHALHLLLPAERRYFSIGALADDTPAVWDQMRESAFAFPMSTRVDWDVDLPRSVVRSRYTVQAQAREGGSTTTIMGLYPHQWDALAEPAPSVGQFATLRGPVRLVRTNRFTLQRPYAGFVPWWPDLPAGADHDRLRSLLAGDNAKSRMLFTRPGPGRGSYWTGKSLGALAQLTAIAQLSGEDAVRDRLLRQLEERMAAWFEGRGEGYFIEDQAVGTLVGYPDEYGSATAVNDHHFHYGYWLMSAAYIALLDPQWMAPEQWGRMIDRIAADIATDERGRRDFPFLRNFDVYEGHSWASGYADFDEGNNQESSSEAVQAWGALMLLGEALHRPRMRDLGAFLYTSEIASVQTYWFDLRHEVFPPEFLSGYASMVFGGRYSYNTWWTEEPRQILGINLLPLTPAATYLGADPDQIHRLFAFLPGQLERFGKMGIPDGTPADIWQDVLAEFEALGDPAAGRRSWDPAGSLERGETRTHVFFWLASLGVMGRPDRDVHADTALFQVFRDAQGARMHLAYNAGDAPIEVHFSDGARLSVPPHQLGVAR